jgi:diacylglycerol O-acyltransferase/trehalose O-mycolyltransferase
MGGLGAISYAARHPGMFQAAASYSGILDTRYQGGPRPGPALIQGLLRAFGQDPDALWGDPRQQAGVWDAHNPTDLAGHLRGVALFVSVGDGQPGPLVPHPTQQASQLERALRPQTLAFVGRLRQLGIPVEVDAAGHGTHDWPDWQQALHRSLPLLQHALGLATGRG